jgi:hypothetical protein
MLWPERSAGIASFDEHARDGRVGARGDRLQHALEDQVLGVGDDRGLLGVGLALDPEELLLEGAAVVEGEDVELVVSGGHGLSIPEVCGRGSRGP